MKKKFKLYFFRKNLVLTDFSFFRAFFENKPLCQNIYSKLNLTSEKEKQWTKLGSSSNDDSIKQILNRRVPLR